MWVQHKTHHWIVPKVPGTKLLHRFQTPMFETYFGNLSRCSMENNWIHKFCLRMECYRCRNVALRHLTPPGEAAALVGAFQWLREQRGTALCSILSILQPGGMGGNPAPLGLEVVRWGLAVPERCPGTGHLPWKGPCPRARPTVVFSPQQSPIIP